MTVSPVSVLRVALALWLSLRPAVEAAPSEWFRPRAAPVVKPIPGYLYIGCYEEPSSGRALASKTANDSMTVELCASIAGGKSYFGLEYGRECWYADLLATDAHPAATEADCSKPCSGDATELCGAGKRLNLYQKHVVATTSGSPSSITTSSSTTSSATGSAVTGPSYVSMGCYQDDAGQNGRTLPDKKYTNDAMTVEICASYAKTLKYNYFGLEYGKECWMANAVNPLAQRSLPPDNPTCTTACPGNATELCGGRSRINLYSFLPLVSTSSAVTSPTTTSSSSLSSTTTTTSNPSGTGSSSVDLTKVILSDHVALATDADGRSVVSFTPAAPGNATIEVPDSEVPIMNPGDPVAVQVTYATTKVVKRAELAQCSLVILLGGVVIYNNVISTTDGNYTTVTVLTNYPTGPTTLIVTENCPGSSPTDINVGGITVGPPDSGSSTSSSATSTTTLSTETDVGPTSVTPQTSSITDDQTATTAVTVTDPSTANSQVPSSTSLQPTTTAPPDSIITPPALRTYAAPPYTSGLCTNPTSFSTAGCALSGDGIATNGLFAIATGIPNPASYPNSNDQTPEIEACASFCAFFDDCESWALDRGNWPSDSVSDWTCYMYTGDVRDYAINYGNRVANIAWYGRGCYDCHGLSDTTTTSEPSTSEAVTTDGSTVDTTTTTTPTAPLTTDGVSTEEPTTSSPSSTDPATLPTTTDSPTTAPPPTTYPPVPTLAAAPYTESTCTDNDIPYMACTISGFSLPTPTESGLLAVITGVAPPPANAGHDYQPQYETCAGECAETEGCLSFVVDTGGPRWVQGDVVLHNWTCLIYDFPADPYLQLDTTQVGAAWDRYIWMESQCFTCNMAPPEPSSSTADTWTVTPSSTTSDSSTSATELPASTTDLTTTAFSPVPTFLAPALGERTCTYPDGNWWTNACTISGYPTATTGLLAVATGVVPVPTGSYDFNPEYQACAAACSDTQGCTGYAMDRGQWPSDTSDWTCYLYSIDIRAWLDASRSLCSGSTCEPIVWMGAGCYDCEPAQTTTTTTTSTTESTTTPLSTTSTPTITAAPVPTLSAPAYDAALCSNVPLGPCSISGYPTATTSLLAVVTGIPGSADAFFEADPEAVSCELACIDTQDCTGFALDRGVAPHTDDWSCYLYNVNVDTYLRGTHAGQAYDPILWFDKGCYACADGTTTTTTIATTPTPTDTPTTTTDEAYTTNTFGTGTCTSVPTPDPTLACSIRGFARPPTYSFAMPAASREDCAAYCYDLSYHDPRDCVSFMWDPTRPWCETFGVDAWTALGDDAPAGAGGLYRNNVIEDRGCWDCTFGAPYYANNSGWAA